jgi:hypothetical protein
MYSSVRLSFQVTIKAQISMPNLLSSLFTRACSHQFAWPRRATDGILYQVCLICGDCFRYDWNTMSRGERIEVVPQSSSSSRKAWKPRSRRIRLEQPMLYRQSDTTEWFRGTLQDISESGVSFVGDESLCAGIEIQMIFVMPQEITGQPNSKVLCRGDIIRSARSKPERYINAVAMSGYSFLPDD